MNDRAIMLIKAPDFNGRWLTQSATGHVHSPWFSFDWRQGPEGEQPYDIGARYHTVAAQARSAFASILGISESEVIVTERRDAASMGELWWRLGTKNPTPLPRPVQDKLPAPIDAIDV